MIVKEQRRRNDCLCEIEQKALKTYLNVCLAEESSDMMFTLVALCLSFFAVLNHQMPAASILAMVEALTSVQKNIFQLPEQMIRLHELESIASRIYKLEGMEEEVAIEELTEDFEKLTVKEVSFGYEEDDILQGVNYTFEKGKFYILAGGSGCGKSTLLKVLARLLPTKNGAVLWNQADLSEMTRESVYKKVMYVSQNKDFLEASIKENICFGENDEVAYQKVLKESFLQDVFDKNQCNDDQVLALSGWPLSSGERQMVSFANVLYMQKQLILLDEAFSAVDPAKEKHFYKKLSRLTENGATVILVSHRLTNFEMSDCILFLRYQFDILVNGKFYYCTLAEVREQCIKKIYAGSNIQIDKDFDGNELYSFLTSEVEKFVNMMFRMTRIFADALVILIFCIWSMTVDSGLSVVVIAGSALALVIGNFESKKINLKNKTIFEKNQNLLEGFAVFLLELKVIW